MLLHRDLGMGCLGLTQKFSGGYPPRLTGLSEQELCLLLSSSPGRMQTPDGLLFRPGNSEL